MNYVTRRKRRHCKTLVLERNAPSNLSGHIARLALFTFSVHVTRLRLCAHLKLFSVDHLDPVCLSYVVAQVIMVHSSHVQAADIFFGASHFS